MCYNKQDIFSTAIVEGDIKVTIILLYCYTEITAEYISVKLEGNY